MFNDFTFIGIFLTLKGTSLLSEYPWTAKKDLDSEEQMFWSDNPFTTKNSIIRSYEMKFGFSSLLLAAIFTILGLYKPSTLLSTLNPCLMIFASFVILAALLKFVTIPIIRALIARKYKPKIIGMECQTFNQCKHFIESGEHNEKESLKNLERISKLLDFPCKTSESCEELIKRLEPYFK